MTFSGRASEFFAQLFVLHTDANRAGVAVALPHHDAAHCHEAERADAKFLGAQNGCDDNIPAGLQAAIGAQFYPVAQAVEGEHLIGFGDKPISHGVPAYLMLVCGLKPLCRRHCRNRG